MEMTETAQVVMEAKKEEKEADHHPYYRPKDAATLILVDRSGSVPKVLVGNGMTRWCSCPANSSFPAAGSTKPTTASR
jgi:hypothetical protein